MQHTNRTNKTTTQYYLIFDHREYIELVSNDSQRPIYPAIIESQRCNITTFPCPQGYEDLQLPEVKYLLEQQTTCNDDPHLFDMKLYKVTTVSFISCRPINPNATGSTDNDTGIPAVEDG